MKRIYLAIPYSGLEELSFELANKIAAKLMNEGHLVFSPISHTHPIAKAGSLPLGWDFWKAYDTTFLEWCEEVHVVSIHTHERSAAQLIEGSKGVMAEIEIARGMGKEIKAFHYHGEQY